MEIRSEKKDNRRFASPNFSPNSCSYRGSYFKYRGQGSQILTKCGSHWYNVPNPPHICACFIFARVLSSRKNQEIIEKTQHAFGEVVGSYTQDA